MKPIKNKFERYQGNECRQPLQNVWIMHDADSRKAEIIQRITDNEHDGEWVLNQSDCKVKDMGEAEMWVSRKHNSSRVTVTVRVTGVLDLRATDLMQSVHELAMRFKAARIIVDLSRTSRIYDSGLAILLLLKEKLGRQIHLIKLVNTGHLTNNCLVTCRKLL